MFSPSIDDYDDKECDFRLCCRRVAGFVTVSERRIRELLLFVAGNQIGREESLGERGRRNTK